MIYCMTYIDHSRMGKEIYKYFNEPKSSMKKLSIHNYKNIYKLPKEYEFIIELLEKGELYSKLEEFYTNELRKYVFFDDIEKEQDIKLNKNEQMIVDKMLEHDDIDINTFEMLFFEIGYKNQFKYSTKKILYHTIGQYYQELYEKLNINSR